MLESKGEVDVVYTQYAGPGLSAAIPSARSAPQPTATALSSRLLRSPGLARTPVCAGVSKAVGLSPATGV